MRTRNTPETSQSEQPQLDTDSDRYPTPVAGIRRILQEAELPEDPIEWLEVQFLASGEATYRMRRPRADEATGGYLPPELQS